MKYEKLKIVTAIFLAFLFSSCAMFSKKRFRKYFQKIDKENISILNGNYTYFPVKRFSDVRKPLPEDNIPDSLVYNNAFTNLLNGSYTTKENIDSVRKYVNIFYLSLIIKNKDSLSIKVFENSIIIRDTTISGKYKNGMFYLNNKFLNCTGIPYILGGCRNNKRRIGLTKNGNLIINEAVSNEGAFLLFFGAGYSYNLSYEYKRK